MKHRIALLALFPCLAGGALAQQGSVSVSGNLDTGLLSTKTPKYSENSQFTSGWTPSFLSFRGTEDLGGGLTASFRLETGINLSNGAIGQYPPSSSFWNRSASVTLSSGIGSLAVGRTSNVAFLALMAVDPRGISNIGSGLQHWTIGNGSSNDPYSLSYTSPNLSGLRLRAQYGFGGVAGNSKALVTRRASADYQAGALTIAAGGFAQNDSTGAKTNSAWILGGAYKFGAFTLKGFAADFNSNFQTGPGGTTTPFRVGELRSYALGGNYSFTPSLSMDFGYYTLKDREGKSKIDGRTLATGLFYKLSTRTTLYAQLASVDNSSAAGTQSALLLHNGANDSPASFTAIGTATQYNAGVRHSF